MKMAHGPLYKWIRTELAEADQLAKALKIRRSNPAPIPTHELHQRVPQVFCVHGKVYRLFAECNGLEDISCKRCA
jgi:hypothetical protein